MENKARYIQHNLLTREIWLHSALVCDLGTPINLFYRETTSLDIPFKFRRASQEKRFSNMFMTAFASLAQSSIFSSQEQIVDPFINRWYRASAECYIVAQFMPYSSTDEHDIQSDKILAFLRCFSKEYRSVLSPQVNKCGISIFSKIICYGVNVRLVNHAGLCPCW